MTTTEPDLATLLSEPSRRFEAGDLLGAFRGVGDVLRSADHLPTPEAYAALVTAAERLALVQAGPAGLPTPTALLELALDLASKATYDAAACAAVSAGLGGARDVEPPLMRRAFVLAAGCASAGGLARLHARALISLAGSELDLTGPLPAQGLCTTAIQLLKQDVARYARFDQGEAHETLGDALAQMMRFDSAARQWTLASECFGTLGIKRRALTQKLDMTSQVTSTVLDLDPNLIRGSRRR